MQEKARSNRVMYVTMGTSLFESATWDATDDLKKLVPEYEDWTRGDPDPRTSPDARRMSPRSQAIREGLKRQLRTNNAGRWAAWLPDDLRNGKPLQGLLFRYSAELTTILKLAETTNSLVDFLNGYDEIRFLYDDKGPSDGGPNLPQIAATHLAHYLNLLAQQTQRAVTVPITGLSSHDPDEVLRGMSKLGDEIGEALEQFRWFDVIASGGYKLYGTLLGDLRYIPSISARLIYLYEEGASVFVSPCVLREPMPAQPDEKAQLRRRWGDWGRQ